MDKYGRDGLGGAIDKLPIVFETRRLWASDVSIDPDEHANWTDELNEVVVATQMRNDGEAGRLVEVAYNRFGLR